MILLKINDKDYTPFITVPSWSVNVDEVRRDWVDGNGVTHRDIIRTKVTGSFKFSNRGQTNRDFDAFLIDLAAVKTVRNSYILTVYCDNTRQYKTIEAFVTYTPAMTRKGGGEVFTDAFSVKIEER